MLICIKCGHPICEESKITKKGIIICSNCKAALFVTPDDYDTGSTKTKPIGKINGRLKTRL